MLQIARFDPNTLQHYQAYDGRYNTWEDMKFDNPQCVAAFAEKRREGDLSAPWHLWNDEVWYIIQGEMELEWSNPPMFNDHHKAVVRPGDLLLAMTGLSIKAQVLSVEPVRFLWVSMPRPRYFGSDAFWGGSNLEQEGR